MDSNNLNETLGIENTNKKWPDNNEIESDDLFKDENRLVVVANIILAVGIISAVILFFTTALVKIGYTQHFSWSGFVTVIITLSFSIGVWAFLYVISNISISLKAM